ncbi:MAG: hypothetical protein NTU54_04310 [Candidatus Omnitrophica bacterium]|nr:hypothetical protein [Candidatus Omnitrophota bacterium]
MSLLRKRRASVLMVSLWVLLILTMLAVSVGHRVSMALKLTQYQRDAVNAAFLAKAGINRAISVIDSNNNKVYNPWANNEDVFKKITFGANEDEFVSVNYVDNDVPKTVFGVRDEESRINIQLANWSLLKQLCNSCYVDTDDQLGKLANYILLWRGDSVSLTGDEGKGFKGAPFANPEELLVVLECFFRDNVDPHSNVYRAKARNLFACIQDKITVWGDGKLNINTVSEPVLSIFLESLATNKDKAGAIALADEIILLRTTNLNSISNLKPFNNSDDIKNLKNQDLLVSFNPAFSFLDSNYFRIQASGTCRNVSRDITAVYDRQGKKVVYWHEN